jgi:NAD(P)-dependent dehydrogenase (short-subunit alcohol dehydrogenase family)
MISGTMTGKAAVVTGAAMGIGRAVALGFAEEGVGVIVADINAEAGKETVELIEKAGGTAFFVQCDVTKEEEIKAMVDAAEREFGRLDYACNNAGIHPEVAPQPFPEIENSLWDLTMEVNLKSVFLCMKQELASMEKQGAGAIVNVASMAGLLAEPGFPVYTASKHGVVGLTKSAAFEYVKKGIRINAVCPAPVDTPMLAAAPKEVLDMLNQMLPMGRVATMEEVAGAVIWLCSDAASYINGIGMPIDGGVSTV